MGFRVFGHCGASDPEGPSTDETENSRGSREVKPPPVGAPRGVMIIYASLANLSYRGSEAQFRDGKGIECFARKKRHLQDSNLRPHRGIDIDASSSLSL